MQNMHKAEMENEAKMWKRLIPAPIDREKHETHDNYWRNNVKAENWMNYEDQVMHLWYWFKCVQDQEWC